MSNATNEQILCKVDLYINWSKFYYCMFTNTSIVI